MAMVKSNSARRREVRRNMPRPPRRWAQWLRRPETAWVGLYVFMFSVVGSLIAVSAADRPGVQVGQVMPRAVVARVRFRAVDQDATLTRKTEARDMEPGVYVPNHTFLSQIRENLNALISLGADESIKSIDQIPPETQRSLQLTGDGLSQLRKFTTDGRPNEKWERLADRFVKDLWYIAVLPAKRAAIERDPKRSKAFRIVIQHPLPDDKDERELERYYKTLISISDDPSALRNRVSLLANKFPSALRKSIVELVMQAPLPTYLYNEEETERRQIAKYDGEPPVEMTYQPGGVLIKAGETVQPLDLQVLEEEQAAYLTQLRGTGWWLTYGSVVGLITLLGVGTWFYTARYNPKIPRNAMRGLAMTALLLLCQAIAVIVAGLAPKYVVAACTFPTLLCAIILAIAYDQRFALAIGVIHSLIVLVSLDLPLGFGLITISGVAVAVGLLHDVRNRSTLVVVGVWSGLAMGLATLLTGLADRPLQLEGEYTRIGFDAFLALATGFATGMIVQGILPTIERLFNVTTSMTLRELNDASHPLLRQLAQEAPGTYQHSLRIGDMAEAAADGIDADGLMCKVGAMYHDIGKVNKPMYFVENQGSGPNRHSKLSPAMSLLIIVGHVKDGMEMAREYNLPRSLRQFIESHHGTTLVEYFYHAAKQQREAQDKPAPTEFEFRYPGPKPQTKEAAILMLCDGVESAARTLDDPTPTRIEQLVHAIANKRLTDGQFDQCHITLQELHKIELSLVKTLCAIYHTRIKYPGDKKDQAPGSPFSAGGPAASAVS